MKIFKKWIIERKKKSQMMWKIKKILREKSQMFLI